MQIARSAINNTKGPGDWFTGDVYVYVVAAAPPPSRVTAVQQPTQVVDRWDMRCT